MKRTDALNEAALICGAEAATYLSRASRAESEEERTVWNTEADRLFKCFETLLELINSERGKENA